MINVSCPSCGKQLSAPDDRAGTRARCPKCGTTVEIPATPIATGPARQESFDPEAMIAEARDAERFKPAGPASVEDATVATLLRALANELRDAHKQLDDVVKHTKRTGQWVAFWSVLALLPFFFWAMAFLLAIVHG